jgi:hypothetical protein
MHCLSVWSARSLSRHIKGLVSSAHFLRPILLCISSIEQIACYHEVLHNTPECNMKMKDAKHDYRSLVFGSKGTLHPWLLLLGCFLKQLSLALITDIECHQGHQSAHVFRGALLRKF